METTSLTKKAKLESTKKTQTESRYLSLESAYKKKIGELKKRFDKEVRFVVNTYKRKFEEIDAEFNDRLEKNKPSNDDSKRFTSSISLLAFSDPLQQAQKNSTSSSVQPSPGQSEENDFFEQLQRRIENISDDAYAVNMVKILKHKNRKSLIKLLEDLNRIDRHAGMLQYYQEIFTKKDKNSFFDTTEKLLDCLLSWNFNTTLINAIFANRDNWSAIVHHSAYIRPQHSNLLCKIIKSRFASTKFSYMHAYFEKLKSMMPPCTINPLQTLTDAIYNNYIIDYFHAINDVVTNRKKQADVSVILNQLNIKYLTEYQNPSNKYNSRKRLKQ